MDHRRWSCVGTALLAATVSFPRDVPAQQADSTADSARVRIVFSGVYDDSEKTKRFLEFLARVLPARRESIAADSSVEAVIFRRYNIAEGPKAQQAGLQQSLLVEELRSQIAELNPSYEKGMLKAGDYVFPTVPPQAAWNADLKTLRSYSPQIIQTSASLTRQVLEPDEWSRAVTVVSAPEAAFSPNRVLDLTMRASEVTEFLAQLDSIGVDAQVTVGSPFAYRQAIPTGKVSAAASYFPDSSGLAALGRAFAAPRRRHVPLVILETNWPSDTIARTSCTSMARILTDVRKRWAIASPREPECGQVAFVAPPDSEVHSATVLRAILPLQRIDSTLVDVIFVPLGRYQGASPLLREVLRVNDIIEQKLVVLDSTTADDAVRRQLRRICRYSRNDPLTFPRCGAAFRLPEANLAAAAARAERVIATLPDTIADPYQRDGYHSATDILTATVRLLSWYAADRGSGAVVNVSWTTDLLGGSIENNVLSNVLVVAAAGNDNLTVTAQQSQVDFGRRAAGSAFVLVALDLDGNGALTCSSSVVDTLPVTRLARQHAIGYDGSVGSRCGTSYAAPRIAWFAAAREAVRADSTDTVHWLDDLRDAFRPAAAPRRLADLKFDPFALFGIAHVAPAIATPSLTTPAGSP